MFDTVRHLYPLNRSILGPDIRKSLEIFSNLNPEFKSLTFRTGEKVFDWEIPEEWIIRDAYIEHESGKKYAEFKKNNLHLMGYAQAKNIDITKNELVTKIFTLPEMSDAIPYITSYYKKNWGFCLSHDEFLTLPEGNYKVFIDSEFKKGKLNILEAIIPGKSDKEIFFSSYLCHPSMANNELSGPVLLNQILTFIKSVKDRHYTYRFVLLPETIGSIAYLSKRLKKLKKVMICGFNLSCVGDERSYSHVESRLGNNLADLALNSALKGLNNVKNYSFLERGSDERQYCAPGIDLPLCTFCKTKFGEFPEYHTSKDDLNLVTEKGLIDSYKVFMNIINSFEIGIYPKIKVLGEPQLGKRQLYPSIMQLYKGKHPSQLRKDTIAYCDSKHNIFEIALKLKIDLNKLNEELMILIKNNLLDRKFI